MKATILLPGSLAIAIYGLLILFSKQILSINGLDVSNRLSGRDENDIQRRGTGSAKRERKSPQRVAIEEWANSLTAKDYNYTEWRISFHSRSTVDFFNGYAKRLSQLFHRYQAKVNFAMIGACDGTGDNTIKRLYIPNEHWRGVFVEPLTMNVRDLVKYMADQGASQRSMIIQAAATAECSKPTIVMERPLYEEKNASIPHWLRRQIGSLLPEHRDHARRDWTTEEVRCITASEILSDWSSGGGGGGGGGNRGNEDNSATALVDSSNSAEKSKNKAKKLSRKKRRPHVLKIDVEGHDYQVLMGFLKEDTPISELPLLIDFEAKSIAKKFPLAKARMEQLGYVVSPFGQDGFALLHADTILASLPQQQQQQQGLGGGSGRKNKKMNNESKKGDRFVPTGGDDERGRGGGGKSGRKRRKGGKKKGGRGRKKKTGGGMRLDPTAMDQGI